MFRIAICDDEKELCTWIEELYLSYAKSENFALDTEVFYTGESLCRYLSNGNDCNLVILDIELKTINGVEIGNFIRKTLKNEYMQIIYISAKQDYAMELFQNRPLDFLLKPLTEKKMIEELKYAIELEDKQEQFICFKTGKTIYRIPCSKIIFLQGLGRKIYVYTTEKKYEYYGKLADLEEVVRKAGFIMVHKSYIINTYYIDRYHFDEIFMTNNMSVPVSQPYRKAIRDFLIKRKMEEFEND